MTLYYDDYDKAVEKIVAHVGTKIVIGIPLGLGKPVGIINALYRLASQNTSIQLTILTGLTLTRPSIRNDLEKKFLEPILEKILGNYEDPLYEHFREKQELPSNIKVIEFFLSPGKFLKNKKVQQDYISTQYANVVRDTMDHSMNVIAQQVSRSNLYPDEWSLSCNTDLFNDVVRHLKEREKQGEKIAVAIEVNANLPFMLGDAIIKSDILTHVVDTKQYRSLFAIPKPQLSIQDHLMGLYSSALVKDGSCLQIGIGKLGDAITNALILRHKENTVYQAIFKKLQAHEKFNHIMKDVGSLTPFEQGLYASTEMLSDGYMHLYREKILKKRVYDHIKLQSLLNAKMFTETITPEWIDILLENNMIHPRLTQDDILFLQHFGIFKSDIGYESGHLILSSHEVIPADLTELRSKKIIIETCLGTTLKSGKIIHAGFFLGSIGFYHQLNGLSQDELKEIEMTTIARTNTLCWSYELSNLQRQYARLINESMMVTLEGTIVSDGLENWQEVSGVGGQFDFAYMAQNLQDARFIINCSSTRYARGKLRSNILWSYPNMTLPRYLRDIVITEYGIADCRSKTDSEVIKSILNITDSRYQKSLLKKAKYFGKVASDYEIPLIFQNNYPEELQHALSEFKIQGLFKAYPFGSELTEEEQVIKNALLKLKNASQLQLIIIFVRALLFFKKDNQYNPYLLRMNLNHPKKIKDYIYKKILKFLISREMTINIT